MHRWDTDSAILIALFVPVLSRDPTRWRIVSK